MKWSRVYWSIGLCALVAWLSVEALATAMDKYTVKDVGAIAAGGTVEGLNNNGQLAGAIPVSQTRNTGWWFDGKKLPPNLSMNGTDEGPSDSMAPDVFISVAFADRDDGAAIAALHQIATQKLGHSFQRGLADVPFHFADAVRREIANDTAMAVKHFFAVVQQPGADQWRDATLL